MPRLLFKWYLLAGTLSLIFMGTAAGAAPPDRDDPYDERPDVRGFVEEMAQRHGFDEKALDELFAGVERQRKVLKAMTTPAEGKPWYEYREIFLTPERVQGGVEFWNANARILDRASHQYGVSPEIIVAIIGIESFYGTRMGGFPVLDTLATLGFDYPPRAKFFRGQLEHFLLLSREEGLDIGDDLKGSYAGAMGMGQFIPSSYRAYAVDFDQNGQRDLWHSNADGIGSVANYFRRHGWETGGQVAVQTEVDGAGYKKVLSKGYEPSLPAEHLVSRGIRIPEDVDGDTSLALMEFETRDGREYWLGFRNFYVITRYNHSPLYAMAVYQLSQEIKNARTQRLADN